MKGQMESGQGQAFAQARPAADGQGSGQGQGAGPFQPPPPKPPCMDKPAGSEEKKGASPKRVGTLTMGLCLVLVGGLILAYMLVPNLNLSWIGFLAPVILILLGLEIVLRYLLTKEQNYRYDFLSAFICLVLVGVCGVVSVVQQWFPYLSPLRYQAQQQMHQQLEEELIQALPADSPVSQLYLHLEAAPSLGGQGAASGYEISYSHLSLTLWEEYASAQDFALACRQVLDHLEGAEIFQLEDIDFSGQGPNTHYSLSVQGRFQQTMDAQVLASQVLSVKEEPDPADGWLPGGYDEMLEAYGPQVADAFLEEAVRQQNQRLGITDDGEEGGDGGTASQEPGETGDDSQGQ